MPSGLNRFQNALPEGVQLRKVGEASPARSSQKAR